MHAYDIVYNYTQSSKWISCKTVFLILREMLQDRGRIQHSMAYWNETTARLTWLSAENEISFELVLSQTGVGKCPFLGDWFHITKTNICWRFIPNSWLMFKWDIYQPLPK